MSEDLNQILKTISGGIVLDVATGNGEFIHTIKEFNSFKSIQAIDKSRGYDAIFNKHFPEDNIKFSIMDGGEMTFETCSFDTVCISNSIHHLEKPDTVFNEMKRVLKPGGRMIINEMVSDQLSQAQISHRDLHHWSASRDRFMGLYHRETYSLKEVEEIIKLSDHIENEKIVYFHEFEDSKSPDLLKDILVKLDQIRERMKADAVPTHILDEGDRIQDHIIEHGFAPASTLFTVLIKGNEA